MNKKNCFLCAVVLSGFSACSKDKIPTKETKIQSIKTVNKLQKNDKEICIHLAPLLLELDAETFKNMQDLYAFEEAYKDWNFEIKVEGTKLTVKPEKYTEVEAILLLTPEKFKKFTCTFPQNFMTVRSQSENINHSIFYPDYMKNTQWTKESAYYISANLLGKAQNRSFGGMFIERIPPELVSRYKNYHQHEIFPLWSFKEEKVVNLIEEEKIQTAYLNFHELLNKQEIPLNILTNNEQNLISGLKWSKQIKPLAFALSNNKDDFMYYNAFSLYIRDPSTSKAYNVSKEAFLYTDNSSNFAKFKTPNEYRKSLSNLVYNSFEIWDVKKQRYIDRTSIEEKDIWFDFNNKESINMIENFLAGKQKELWLNLVVEAENAEGYESILAYYDKNGEIHQESSKIIIDLTKIKLPDQLRYEFTEGN